MHQRARDLIRKWRVLVALMDGMPLEALPPLLASEDTMTKELASKRFQECLDSMSTEELPKFLTDTDPVVREVAGDLLGKSQKLKGGDNK